MLLLSEETVPLPRRTYLPGIREACGCYGPLPEDLALLKSYRRSVRLPVATGAQENHVGPSWREAFAAATSTRNESGGFVPLSGPLYIAVRFLLGACGVNTGNLRGQRSALGAADSSPFAASRRALTANAKGPYLLRSQAGEPWNPCGGLRTHEVRASRAIVHGSPAVDNLYFRTGCMTLDEQCKAIRQTALRFM